MPDYDIQKNSVKTILKRVKFNKLSDHPLPLLPVPESTFGEPVKAFRKKGWGFNKVWVDPALNKGLG